MPTEEHIDYNKEDNEDDADDDADYHHGHVVWCRQCSGWDSAACDCIVYTPLKGGTGMI